MLMLGLMTKISSDFMYVSQKDVARVSQFRSRPDCIVVGSCSGALRTQKLGTHLLRSQGSKVLPLQPRVDQNIALHAQPTARDFLLSKFPIHSPSFFAKPFPSF